MTSVQNNLYINPYEEAGRNIALSLMNVVFNFAYSNFLFLSSGNLGTRFHITKYPTLKYVRNGVLAKREYRGQRSVEAFVKFVQEQTEDSVVEYKSLEELSK